MSRATPKMRDFAEQLIAYESTENKSPGIEAPVTLRVVGKLRPQLANLMGNAGFRALLSRSLALAAEEAPWLRAAHVKEDGTLGGVDELEAKVRPDDFYEGRVVLVAQLLGLLAAFIGEKLTLQVVGGVWPHLSFNGSWLGQRDKYEKAN